jgi:hypothetical protein
MKYMIRRESNQFDPKLIMYNVYEAHKYVPGKASGYRHGSIDLEGARQYIAAQANPPISELIEEITV